MIVESFVNCKDCGKDIVLRIDVSSHLSCALLCDNCIKKRVAKIKEERKSFVETRGRKKKHG